MTQVCHIIKATRLSGAERHLLILLPELRARGVDAHLLLLTEPGQPMDTIAQAAAAAGIPLTRLVIRRGIDLTIIPRLRRTLRALRPRIVHTHLIHADLLGMIAARLARVPHIVSTRHNDDAFRRRLPLRLVNGWNWRGLTAGVVISDALGEFVRTVEGAPAHKVHRIHYGLPSERFSPHDIELARRRLRLELKLLYDTQLIGIVARLVEQKGIPYGLEAFSRVAAEFPQAHVVVAGDGPLREALQAQASGLGLAERVHFLGWREDARAVLQGLDVLLLPSLWEGFGLTLLEAMSARVPVIASYVSAIPEIVVHGETGFLTAPRDAEAIAYALRLLLPDALLRKHMGLNGEDRLETHFSAARMAEQTAALYAALG